MDATRHAVPQPQSRLLALPPELRTQIYAHLLQSRLPAPEPLSLPRKFRRDPVVWPSDPDRLSQNDSHRAQNLVYLSSGLALACRQTSQEIHDLVRRNKSSFPYHLDLVLEHGYRCFPTWLCLPAPTHWYYELPVGDASNLDNALETKLDVDVNLRLGATLPENQDDDDAAELHLRWAGNGGPGEAATMLLTVLGHWCENGPRFTKTLPPASSLWCDGGEAESNRGIQTQELRMHFVSWARKRPATPQGLRAFAGDKAPERLSWQQMSEHPQMEHWSHLKWELERLATCGLLYGRIQRLNLDVVETDLDEDVLSFEVRDVPPAVKRDTAIEWAHYGWLPGA